MVGQLVVDQGCRARGFVAPTSLASNLRTTTTTTATPPSSSPSSLLLFGTTLVPHEQQQNRATSARRPRASPSLTSINASRLSRTACSAAANSSTDFVLDPSPSSTSSTRTRETIEPAADASITTADAVVAVEAAPAAAAATSAAAPAAPPGDDEVQEEEEGGWAEDFQAVEMLSKGAGAVGEGVKSVARASSPLKRKPDGSIVMDADGLLNLVCLR